MKIFTIVMFVVLSLIGNAAYAKSCCKTQVFTGWINATENWVGIENQYEEWWKWEWSNLTKVYGGPIKERRWGTVRVRNNVACITIKNQPKATNIKPI